MQPVWVSDGRHGRRCGRRATLALAAGLGFALWGVACVLDSQEAERVELPVVVADAPPAPGTSDLGYEVELSSARVVMLDLQFTTQGEQSGFVDDGVIALVDALMGIRDAHAHPGHLEGGEIIGELPGRHVVDFADGGLLLGEAIMLTAKYDSLNFTFGRGTEGDGLSTSDALLNHSVVLEGTARRDDRTWDFVAVIDQDEGRQMIGGPFQAQVRLQSQGPVALSMQVFDPISGESLFDGVDFEALGAIADNNDAADAGAGVVISRDDANTAEAHNRIRNALQRHPYYGAALLAE